MAFTEHCILNVCYTSTGITNTYKVTVYTGKVFGAGTDANVYIVFVGEIGETGSFCCLIRHNTHLTALCPGLPG